jgi:tetratricopeptide (TPR) repeat protein
MKTSQRHHLKDNELAIAIGAANEWAARNRRNVTMVVGTIALVAVAAAAFVAWRSSVDARAREALAQAMVVAEARVQAPPPPGADPTQAAPPQAGTYPNEKAKLEAALPKFLSAADAYPGSDAGRTARYHAGITLAELGRFDEAVKQYDQLSSGDDLLSQSARLGKAEAHLRAGQHDAAISTFKELSDKADSNLPKEALLLELARAYKVAGKTEDAKKTLNEIVEKHADSPLVSTAKQELEKLTAG